MKNSKNIDVKTVEGFGDEWARFDQTKLSDVEQQELFNDYFSIFPWLLLPKNAEGFDLGCGSGRWAKLVSGKVGHLHCIDPSAAIDVAKRNLENCGNCSFYKSSVDSIPLLDESMDFGYSLGVLHHVPDTEDGVRKCVRKLKPGAPFLVYLYYSFDNRPYWYQIIWKMSEVFRAVICKFPYNLRYVVSQAIAFLIYWPIARLALLLDKFGINISNMPLSAYRTLSLYTMRTDALDRFGTRLEQRFSREQIENMMRSCGLERIEFSEKKPYWCALGYKKFEGLK